MKAAVSEAAPGRVDLAGRAGRAWRRLLALLSPSARRRSSRDDEPVFRKIDVDGLKRDLRLRDQAVRYGEAGLPPVDTRELDGPQKQIRAHLRNELAEGFRRTNRRIARLWSALNDRDVAALVDELEDLPERRRGEVALELRELKREREAARAVRSESQAELEAYRQRHGFHRPLALRSSADRKRLLSLTVGIALAQAAANSALFAQGATYGLAAGLFLAAMLGIFDVVAHGWLGRIASRVRAPERLNTVLGTLFLGIILFSVPAWNLGMVHLRLGIRTQGLEQGVEQWLPSLVNNTWGFTDFWSWALLLIGLLCSILAVVAGFTWDEPVPEYRRLGRRIEEATEDEEVLSHEIDRLQADVEEEIRLETTDLRDTVRHHLNVQESLFRDIASTHQNLVAYIADAREAYATLIRFYRDENAVARAGVAPRPEYFDVDPDFDSSLPMKLEVGVDEVRAWVARQRQIAAPALNNGSSAAEEAPPPLELRS